MPRDVDVMYGTKHDAGTCGECKHEFYMQVGMMSNIPSTLLPNVDAWEIVNIIADDRNLPEMHKTHHRCMRQHLSLVR